ncbi:phage tail tube protein [Melghirimyces algeriensis]|uniref:Predicted secreted protein n=1 Tax=Melghirimyces algeriensis TaxID=910412 RepID=A0A521BNW0_9BACL|nr:phage tail tube protein [Melghirimyces algeriensis]SMO48828.1 Predicted secreted protein [Melghirimyces algeriensis]
MATQAIPGFEGSIYLSKDQGTTLEKVAAIKDSTLTISQEELEASSFESNGWMEYVPGLKEWELEAEGIYLMTDAGQESLYQTLVDADTVLVRLFPKDGSGNKGYEGNAFITSWEVNNAVDDIVTLSATFRGTGEIQTITAADPAAS